MYIFLIGIFIYIKPLEASEIKKYSTNHWTSLNR